jgi:hypothetical protein
MSNIGSTKLSSPWKKYDSQKYRKPLPPIQVGDKFHRLTVIEILPRNVQGDPAVHVCRCECDSDQVIKTSSQSLRKGFVRSCKLCAALEKKMAREIEAAKEVERLTSPHVDPAELPARPRWEFQGAEDELIAEAEKQG